ncbi:uncharacterized protein LOC105167442 [Sesamum indicum]|uniref:Uncharacterized protein LOC105167442 n=1 Tax=Sesamum indicum TaxID=4182 RepID=A0A6I9TVX0_SESIN|nr:uncharacterized protein LOC105167442 [Sesamum indicum]
MSPISSDGAPLPLAMVIEYLESSMSTELLGKFPDNSAFDFNYSQSSIWSPLLPRPPRDSDAGGLDLSRKLSFGDGGGVGFLENTKKVAARIKRKFTDAVLQNISRCRKMKRRKRKSFGFSPVPSSSRRLSSSSPSPKAWAKVMKAAAKHFKKKKNKKKDSNLHLDDLSNHFTDGNL